MKFTASAVAATILFTGAFSLRAEPAQSESPASKETAAPAVPSAEGEKATPVSSALSWDHQKVEVDAKLGQMVIRGTYRFTNTSKNPITFVDLVPSCGCLATQIDKLDFAPGESGELKATLDLESEDDPLQDRTILVTTSDAPKVPTTLRFLVRVPTTVEMSVKYLNWTLGEKATTKEVMVTAGPGVEDMKLSQESENGDFAVHVKTEVEGRSYRVSITPKDTSAVSYAEIRLNAESASFRRPITEEIRVSIAKEK